MPSMKAVIGVRPVHAALVEDDLHFVEGIKPGAASLDAESLICVPGAALPRRRSLMA